MRWTLRRVVWCALAAACGTTPSTRFSDYDREVQRATCERLARCQLFPDEASCLSYVRLAPSVSLAAAIDAGKTRYDARRASECIEQIAQQSCDLTAGDARALQEACAAVFAGALEGGEPCALDAECASGTCAFPASCPESGCCVGACRAARPPGAEGASCAKDRDCQGALVCSKSQTCQELAGAGESCQSDHECADGLGCSNPLATMPGICRPLPHLGEPCPYLRCADEGLRCDDSGTRTCVPLGLPGAPCASGADCSPYMECNPDSRTCQELPSLGMSCSGACQGASFCLIDATTGAGTCAAPKDNGEDCESVNECASDYCFVAPDSETCTDPPVCL